MTRGQGDLVLLMLSHKIQNNTSHSLSRTTQTAKLYAQVSMLEPYALLVKAKNTGYLNILKLLFLDSVT